MLCESREFSVYAVVDGHGALMQRMPLSAVRGVRSEHLVVL